MEVLTKNALLTAMAIPALLTVMTILAVRALLKVILVLIAEHFLDIEMTDTRMFNRNQ